MSFAATLAPAGDEFAPHYKTYVSLVPPGDVIGILTNQISETLALYSRIPEDWAGYRYADGKWTVRQTLGHIVDAERVFTYRALRFSRLDPAPLPSFDQSTFVENGPSEAATLAELREEFDAVRRATLYLFRGLGEGDWTRSGIASDARISVRALARVVAGHELHHRQILADRYLPGIPSATR